jgi:glycogen operon protein
VPEADRGSFSGLAHSEIPAYLRSLGIGAELLPIHAFLDDSMKRVSSAVDTTLSVPS